jgi:hypothetical protein
MNEETQKKEENFFVLIITYTDASFIFISLSFNNSYAFDGSLQSYVSMRVLGYKTQW